MVEWLSYRQMAQRRERQRLVDLKSGLVGQEAETDLEPNKNIRRARDVQDGQAMPPQLARTLVLGSNLNASTSALVIRISIRALVI